MPINQEVTTMKTYEISFKGREVGSIGIMQNYKVLIVAKDEKEAVHKLYGTHEHISQPVIKVVA